MNFKRATVKSFVVSALAMSAAGFAVDASAATAVDTMTVGANVVATCTITTIPIAFGNYDAAVNRTTAMLGTGTVSTTCTNGLAAEITLSEGANPDATSGPTVPVRRMVSAGNFIGYFLYKESGRTTAWANGVGTGSAYVGTGFPNAMTVYGTIPEGQNVPAGAYTDTVTATVTF